MQQPKFEAMDTTLRVEIGRYRDNGNMAVSLIEEDGFNSPFGSLSVNIDLPLAEGEFFAKTWSENDELAQAALASGVFEDTGRRVPYGFVEAQVWRLMDQRRPA